MKPDTRDLGADLRADLRADVRPDPRPDSLDAPVDAATTPPRDAPGGPYFGRLLAVLLVAVAFCGLMTWLLSTTVH